MAKKVRLNTTIKNLGLKNLTEVRDYLVGKKIIPVTYNSGHNYEVGVKYKIDDATQINGSPGGYYVNGLTISNGYLGNTMYLADCELCDSDLEDVKEELKRIDSRIETLNNNKELLKEQVQFLTESKTEILDELKFKRYMMKKILSGTLTEDEKVSRIETLLIQ